ncbi:peptidoglycan DD-metalloendopeptidase family protein [Aureitalea marina]|uniref:Peptidase M23 n=1 Tax=Aureitalea marina TaxID=930804 RepID=A0A2S7KTQ5_9FLAO|nr:peptidoglycan DD-metalloendopeptidase family protein [Aureitalea marina]PQB05938.1 hypothetical protein BST85_03340 [Aureitalea marina]
MKRLISCIFMILATALSLGQQPSYMQQVENFKTNFNQGDSQAVFDMLNEDVQKQLGFETIDQILKDYREAYGNIDSLEFIQEGNLAEVYLLHFVRGKQKMALSLDRENKLSGLRFMPVTEDVTPKIERNLTRLSLPFKGEWFTVWGGDTKAQNYHVISNAQRRAFDFLVLGSNNKTYQRSGTRNEDYWAFGKPIFAVCDALVVEVITGVEDNKPGAMNPRQALGNSVTLLTDKGEYIVYAHFEKGTVKVSNGERVKRGQLLGNCGNSGNSSEPHLHLHIQDGPKMLTSVGIKCFFDRLMVNKEIREDYSPIRLDRIRSIEN